MKIKPENKERYLRSPFHCPFCGHREIESGLVDSDCDTATTATVGCPACKAKWTDIYKLVDVKEAE